MAIINNSQGLFITLPINTKYSPVTPGVEDFPTHYDQNGYGGFMAIDSSINELSGITSLTGKYERIIPELRRKKGMMIYDVSPTVSSFYQCTDVVNNSWEEVDFKFRYFYGPTAPSVSNIRVGEKWFDTIVGSEYTYLPIAEGSSQKAWVDIDHVGEGETFSGYITLDLANTYYVNIGGDVMTGSLTAHKVFRDSNDENFEDDEFVTKSFVFSKFIESSGGIFTGHITGTSAKFSSDITGNRFFALNTDISSPNQLVTRQYVDSNTVPGVDFHIDDQQNPFATEVSAISISGGANINVFFDQLTTPPRYVISSSASIPLNEYVKISGDVMTGSLTAQNIRSNGNLSGITITGTNATIGISGDSSDVNITQPFLNVLRIGGAQQTNRVGFTAGTNNFLNLPRIVLGDYSSNQWGWPSAIDFEARLTNGGANTGIGFRIGPLWSHSPPNTTRSDLVFWGAPGKIEGGVGISGGPSGEGLERLGFFRYGSGLIDNGFHIKNALYTEGVRSTDSIFVTKNEDSQPTNILQPFISITKGLTQAPGSGIDPGSNNFMNLPRVVIGNHASNSWGWPSAIDLESRFTANGNTGIVFRIGSKFVGSDTNAYSNLEFFGAPSRPSSGPLRGIVGGLSGSGLNLMGYFRNGLSLDGVTPREDNGLHVNGGLFGETIATAKHIFDSEYNGNTFTGWNQNRDKLRESWLNNLDYQRTLVYRTNEQDVNYHIKDTDTGTATVAVRYLSWKSLGFKPPFNILIKRFNGDSSNRTSFSMNRGRLWSFVYQFANVDTTLNPGMFIRYRRFAQNNVNPSSLGVPEINTSYSRLTATPTFDFVGLNQTGQPWSAKMDIPSNFCPNCPMIDLDIRTGLNRDWVMWEIKLIPLNNT